MARHITSVCNFVLGFVKCKLPEDMVNVEVKIRTLQGTHTLKENREYCTLKFRLWRGQGKPFKTLKVTLSRYIKRKETVAIATAASVTCIFDKAEEEKGEHVQQPQAHSSKDTNREQSVGNIFKSAPLSYEQEQLKPRVWMGACILNDPNCERKGTYCDVCNPNGWLFPSTWANRSNHMQNEATEEEEEEVEEEEEEEGSRRRRT